MDRAGIVQNLVVTVVASFILVLMGIVYFMISLWVVKFSSSLIGYTIEGNWAVVSAAILVSGIIVGSAIKNG